MPYTQKQMNYFATCEHNPGMAKGKCPSKADSHKMLHEGMAMGEHPGGRKKKKKKDKD